VRPLQGRDVVCGLWVVDVFLGYQRPFRARWSLDICEPKGRKSKDGRQMVTGFKCQGLDTCRAGVENSAKQLTVAAHRDSLGAGQPPSDQELPTDFRDGFDFGNPRARLQRHTL
jgi:hypothetical protein